MKSATVSEGVQRLIVSLRGQRVLIDADLASLYGVKTKALNQAVKRNMEKFPDDFMFPLAPGEKIQLVTKCDRFKGLKHSSTLPNAFTEFGALMAANCLNSPKAVEMSIYIVRAFVEFRKSLAISRQFAEKLTELEYRVGGHDTSIKTLLSAIRELTVPVPPTERRKIGF